MQFFFTLKRIKTKNSQRAAERVRRAQQLLRTAQLRFGRRRAAGQPCKLRAALCAVKLHDAREGASVLLALLDGKVRSREGADPGAVLFDSLQAAKARNVDVVFCDTAGRLHNKANLMQELSKLRKIIDRETPDAAKETLLVLDATTGQNGLQQAKVFRETAGLTGIILTKLDGTAKGGICVAIAQELGVPVKFVGLGEGIDDLQPFDAKEYVNALI